MTDSREKSLVINSDRQARSPPPWWFTYFFSRKGNRRKDELNLQETWSPELMHRLQPATGLHNPWLSVACSAQNLNRCQPEERLKILDQAFSRRRKILISFRTLCALFSLCFFAPVLLTCLVNSFPFFKTQLMQPLCEGPSHFLCEDSWP